ncbi:hypothetical protein LOZ66_006152 [Ophidiomyces ophidiicola]|nr:hypothetical protein LOZ66_006152 [Ophidiomyces ophidiicola]
MSGARKLPSTEVSGCEARTNFKNFKCDSQQPSVYQTKSPVELPIKPDRKRRRDQAEEESCTQHSQSANIRKKRNIGLLIHSHSISMADPNSHPNYTPTVNHEDISDEVEARLKLKEIARRNINGQREKKRKRDGSQSPSECSTIDSSTILRRKRLRTKNGSG